MKVYKVKLLTQKGIIEKVIDETQDLNKLSEEIIAKYGTFTTISSKEIKPKA